jgi:hypothetical protein
MSTDVSEVRAASIIKAILQVSIASFKKIAM